jgi:hypothetical protein
LTLYALILCLKLAAAEKIETDSQNGKCKSIIRIRAANGFDPLTSVLCGAMQMLDP